MHPNMAYKNNHRKFAVVINRSHPMNVIMNAVAHVAFGLSHKSKADSAVMTYVHQATGFDARISEFPFIVLETHNSGQLASLLLRARADEAVSYNVFTASMIGPSADAQISNTSNADSASLDYVVVLLFGDRERVDPLTKKYSLFKE
jgi:hypothetical protein